MSRNSHCQIVRLMGVPEFRSRNSPRIPEFDVSRLSGKVNTNSGNHPKSVHVCPEWLLTFVRNRCSRSARMTVHDGTEYAG